jgi:hypothetical protein
MTHQFLSWQRTTITGFALISKTECRTMRLSMSLSGSTKKKLIYPSNSHGTVYRLIDDFRYLTSNKPWVSSEREYTT